MPGVDPQGGQKYWGPNDSTFVGVQKTAAALTLGGQKYWGPRDGPAKFFLPPPTGTNFPALTVAP